MIRLIAFLLERRSDKLGLRGPDILGAFGEFSNWDLITLDTIMWGGKIDG